MLIDIEALRADEIADEYRDVGDRSLAQQKVWLRIAKMLEKIHAAHFGRVRGRYVRTGAVKSSLTGHGSGAIRNVDAQGLEFGSSVWYAHFLTKAPKDPYGHQVPKSHRPDLLYAVLVNPPETQKRIAEAMGEHVVGDFGAGR